jgi:hypothetical protein
MLVPPAEIYYEQYASGQVGGPRLCDECFERSAQISRRTCFYNPLAGENKALSLRQSDKSEKRAERQLLA